MGGSSATSSGFLVMEERHEGEKGQQTRRDRDLLSADDLNTETQEKTNTERKG